MSAHHDLLYIQNFIDGQFVDAVSGEWLDNYEPATGSVYSKVASSDAQDVELAYQAAHNAFPAWRKTTTEQRSKYLYRIAELLSERLVRAASMSFFPLVLLVASLLLTHFP